jgi:hypothetical protein
MRLIKLRLYCVLAVVMANWCTDIPMTAQAASPEYTIPCDIQQAACSRQSGDGMSIVFDVQPKPVASMSESTFIVTLSRSGKPVTDAAIHIDLSMPGMFMGKNQPVLTHRKDGRYEGKGIITSCVSGKKTWLADVVIDSAGATTVFGFIFEVK